MKKSALILILGMACAAGLGLAQGALPYYTRTLLDPPPAGSGFDSIAAINAAGIVVGSIHTSGSRHAYRWLGDRTGAALPELSPAGQSYALAVNDSAVAVGYSVVGGRDTAMRWPDVAPGAGAIPAPKALPEPGPLPQFNTGSRAQAVNGVGISSGYYIDSGNKKHACYWLDTAVFKLTDGGAIESQALGMSNTDTVGTYDAGMGDRACVWEAGVVFVPLPDPAAGATSTRAIAIDASGLILGTYDQGGVSLPCTWSKAGAAYEPAILPLPENGTLAEPRAANDSGRIVGAYETTDMYSHACTWQGGEVSPLPEPAGAFGSDASAINASGQIAGFYQTATELFAYVLTPGTPPSPPAVVAPAIKITGRKKLTTAKAKLTIKGKATGQVTSVTYKIGSKPAKRAKGTASWSIQAALKPGKNKITITAHGPGGDSVPAKLTVTRKP